ncbi:MAG: YlbF family regulator [Balneolales bacterium]|nr:YlbF family regulator [Balneolales bacterium]
MSKPTIKSHEEACKNLINGIKELPVYQDYTARKSEFENNEQARTLINHFNEVYQRVNQGPVAEQDKSLLKEISNNIENNTAISAFHAKSDELRFVINTITNHLNDKLPEDLRFSEVIDDLN